MELKNHIDSCNCKQCIVDDDDWNKCKGFYLAEFEQGNNNQLIITISHYILLLLMTAYCNYW